MSTSQRRVGAAYRVAIHGGAQPDTGSSQRTRREGNPRDDMNKSGLRKEAAW
jgi:hypothetical protein